MDKSFRVEFNTTGFYSGQGIFEALDETVSVEADSAQEAIELVIDWLEADEPECREYAWRAAERIETKYGVELGAWELWEG